MEQKAYTIKDMVEMTVDILNNIPVPLKHHEMIAVPIHEAVENLESCLRAWEEEERLFAEQAMQEAAAVEQEQNIEPISEEPEEKETET